MKFTLSAKLCSTTPEFDYVNQLVRFIHCSVEVPIHFRIQSNDPISCNRKPAERTDEIKGYAISLVRSTASP